MQLKNNEQKTGFMFVTYYLLLTEIGTICFLSNCENLYIDASSIWIWM